MSSETPCFKIVAVGDGSSGKNQITIVFGHPNQDFELFPVCENIQMRVPIRERTVLVQIWDTTGQEEQELIRTLSYTNAHVFVLCFSVVDPSSFEHARTMWIDEIRQYSKDPLVILVGTRTELRSDDKTLEELRQTGQRPVTPEEGSAAAREMKAIGYRECSAKTKDGVNDVFNLAIKAAFDDYQHKSQRKGCLLL